MHQHAGVIDLFVHERRGNPAVVKQTYSELNVKDPCRQLAYLRQV